VFSHKAKEQPRLLNLLVRHKLIVGARLAGDGVLEIVIASKLGSYRVW